MNNKQKKILEKYKIVKIEQGSVSKIKKFINEIDPEFVPSLSSRVEIGKWSKKLMELSINYGVLDLRGDIKAMISFYANQNRDSYIIFLAVSKSFRGKGISKKLLDKSIDYCSDIKSSAVCVQTWLSNEKVIKLYHSRDFIDIEIKNDREDSQSLIMKKQLISVEDKR